MENKIWYKISNLRNYNHLPGVLWVQPKTFCSLENTIQASIDSFNLNIDWDDMWNIKDAKERLDKGHDLFLGVDETGPIAHVWFDKYYLYNLYVDQIRPEGYSESFVKAVLNFIQYDEVRLYCDEWNFRAQKLFEKVGFTKI